MRRALDLKPLELLEALGFLELIHSADVGRRMLGNHEIQTSYCIFQCCIARLCMYMKMYVYNNDDVS